MHIATLTSIHRYPVKSMAGETLERAHVGKHGLPGDRAFAIFDPAERKTVSASDVKAYPGLLDLEARYHGHDGNPFAEIELPDGRIVRSNDPRSAELLSAWFGHPAQLASLCDDASQRPAPPKYAMAGTFFDYAPLHLLTDTSMRSLQARAESSQVALRRFRPNLFLQSTVREGYPENEWIGRRLRIGDELVLEITDPCPRCSMATLAQGELEYDPKLLKEIARANTLNAPFLQSDQPSLGAYAFVHREGVVQLGDPVVLDEGSS